MEDPLECGKAVVGLWIVTLTDGSNGIADFTRADDVPTTLDRFHDGARVRVQREGSVLKFATKS